MDRDRPNQNPPEVPKYLRVARFPTAEIAGRLYFAAQDAIFQTPRCELSVYRLLFQRDWFVAVLGDPPSQSLDRQLRRLLSSGDSATLPDEILQALQQRRTEATHVAPWVERHHVL